MEIRKKEVKQTTSLWITGVMTNLLSLLCQHEAGTGPHSPRDPPSASPAPSPGMCSAPGQRGFVRYPHCQFKRQQNLTQVLAHPYEVPVCAYAFQMCLLSQTTHASSNPDRLPCKLQMQGHQPYKDCLTSSPRFTHTHTHTCPSGSASLNPDW